MRYSQFIILVISCFMLSTFKNHIFSKDKNLPVLIPKPNKIELRTGHFNLDSKTKIYYGKSTTLLGNYLSEQIFSMAGIKLETNQLISKADGILLKIEEIKSNNPEAYVLNISDKTIEIKAKQEIGLFFGIQTLLQMIQPGKKSKDISISCCNISDEPRFSWRGLNLDVCRHFMTKDFVKRYIDILAYFKLNTLHWHLTEDQGWRIEINKYPKLTSVGGWRKEADGSIYGGFYTQEDIKEIVEYAKTRYINIVPEIEMPGHSLASLASYPENSCTGGPFEVATIWGVLKDVYCAGKDSTFIFLQNILDEVITLFPGEYIHIGGDEVPKDRWKECPKCQARIKAEGLKDEHELQSYFIKRISNYLITKGKKVIGWDEILQGGLAPGVIVQSWQGYQGAIDAARLGHQTILSPTSHTYYDYETENTPIEKVYSFDPIPEELSNEESKLVIGSEANIWTERTPQETVDNRLFPRLLALSEVLWTEKENKNYEEFYSRLQKYYPVLSSMGIKYGLEGKAIYYSTSYNKEENQFIVTLTPGQKNIELRYTLDGNNPDENSTMYSSPIKIDKSTKLKVSAYKDRNYSGKTLTFPFYFHQGLGVQMKIKNSYNKGYSAGGDNSLVDGIRGSNNFRDGIWQGYEGVDFEGTIDLGQQKEITKVTTGFLQDANSWIFMPEYVEFSYSEDNVNYSEPETVQNSVPQKSSELYVKDFSVNGNKKLARYIKVKAKTVGKCPEWHPGAGGLAWLFLDEIIVE